MSDHSSSVGPTGANEVPGVSRRGILKAGLAVTATGVAAAAVPTVLSKQARAATNPSAGRRVAVFGAGPAGMTTAHELAERGFTVDVYEKEPRLGGMVRSFVTQGGGVNGRPSLPNTCGGHYILPGYASWPDLLSRVPTGDGRYVIDRITSAVGADGIELGINGRQVKVQIPITFGQMKTLSVDQLASSFVNALSLIGGASPMDAPILASKLAALITSGPRRQAGQLSNIDLEHQFFRSDALSPVAQTLIRLFADTISWDSAAHGVTPTAYLKFWFDPVINMIFGRRAWPNSAVGIDGTSLLNAPLLGLNAMLDGPETEVLFDPWAQYLKGLGVTFHTERTLTGIGTDSGRIAGATVQDPAGGVEKVQADYYVLALNANRTIPLLDAQLLAADPGLSDFRRLEPAIESGFELHFRDPLPFGRLASIWNDWGLTMVGLSDIWKLDMRDYGDGSVQGFASVEFNNHPFLDQPGVLYGKPIKDLTYQQAFDEVRTQIIQGIPDGGAMFAGGNFLGWRPHPTLSWGSSGWAVPDQRNSSAPGTMGYFPNQVRAIPNLFLAGGHTRNSTGGDAMEGAAESGKIVTTAIMHAAGVNEHPVSMPYYGPPPELVASRAEDDLLYSFGMPNVFDNVAPARMPGR